MQRQSEASLAMSGHTIEALTRMNMMNTVRVQCIFTRHLFIVLIWWILHQTPRLFRSTFVSVLAEEWHFQMFMLQANKFEELSSPNWKDMDESPNRRDIDESPNRREMLDEAFCRFQTVKRWFKHLDMQQISSYLNRQADATLPSLDNVATDLAFPCEAGEVRV